jgi:hypothetical protein
MQQNLLQATNFKLRLVDDNNNNDDDDFLEN